MLYSNIEYDVKNCINLLSNILYGTYWIVHKFNIFIGSLKLNKLIMSKVGKAQEYGSDPLHYYI